MPIDTEYFVYSHVNGCISFYQRVFDHIRREPRPILPHLLSYGAFCGSRGVLTAVATPELFDSLSQNCLEIIYDRSNTRT